MATRKAAGSSSKDDRAANTSLMLAKLETSCLTAADAKLLGMKVVDAAFMGTISKFAVPAFEIPYFTLDGKHSKFRRFRFLADTRTGFAKHTDEKQTRYVQEAGTIQEAYFPPLLSKELGTWADVAKDTERSVIITEGELKAACATKSGYPTIGLGGVWSFRNKKGLFEFLPALNAINWMGRRVVICFDSDADRNAKVVQARDALATVLTEKGARVRIATMPATEDGKKQGIDDFILAQGDEAFLQILLESERYDFSEALHKLNNEVAWIKDPGFVVVLDTAQRIKHSDFTGAAYANRYYNEVTEIEEDDKGEEVVVETERKPIARPWLTWPHRFELKNMEFTPGQGKFTEAGGYNTWPGWGVEPKKGDITPWRELLDLLFGEEKDARQWFERWLAIPIQHPGAKMHTAAVLWGIQPGTGKSLVGSTMQRVYGKTFGAITEAQLNDPRMAWAENKCFIMGDDVAGHEQRKVADRLKAMITQEMLTIDVKYVPLYSVADHVNYYFTSNHPDAFYIEDEDRRFFIHEVTCLPANKEFYDNYMKWLNAGGAAALMYHLQHLNLGTQDHATRAMRTEAKERMIEDGMGDLARWVRRLKTEPDRLLCIGDVPSKCDLYSSQDLMTEYQKSNPQGKATTTAIGRELKRAGIPLVYQGRIVQTATGGKRLFALRNVQHWTNGVIHKDLTSHYNETRGLDPKSPAEKALAARVRKF